jgi:hypothetical protein
MYSDPNALPPGNLTKPYSLHLPHAEVLAYLPHNRIAHAHAPGTEHETRRTPERRIIYSFAAATGEPT